MPRISGTTGREPASSLSFIPGFRVKGSCLVFGLGFLQGVEGSRKGNYKGSYNLLSRVAFKGSIRVPIRKPNGLYKGVF